jgi:hypothetical protein
MEETKRFAATVEAWLEEGQVLTDDDADALLEGLLALEVEGPTVAIGGDVNVVATTFTFDVFADADPRMFAAQAAHAAVGRFVDACVKAGIAHGDIALVEVIDETRRALDIDQPSEHYLGVSEVASMLGVSRQRISELRTRSGFPAPLAELASGPVWRESVLRYFLETWARTPGRPRKEAASRDS